MPEVVFHIFPVWTLHFSFGLHILVGLRACMMVGLLLMLLAMCTMPQESRVCGEYNIKWLFDGAAGVCTRSWDSGCNVDAHRFDNEEECKAVCVDPSAYGTTVCFSLLV